MINSSQKWGKWHIVCAVVVLIGILFSFGTFLQIDTKAETDSFIETERNTEESEEEQDRTEKTDIDEGRKKELSKSYQIADFPLILQLPELPTGCEITALTMVWK